MVKITNGNSVLTVTSGAYHSMYKPQGWRPVDEQVQAKVVAPAKKKAEPISVGIEAPEPDPDTDVEAEELETEDLSEKPLKEMSFEELRAYATQLKIDITDLDSKKNLREAIREVIN